MAPLEHRKVVTAAEMARIEAQSISQGASEPHYMENAGSAIARITEDYILSYNLERKVIVLAGKGNNGGDGYAAAKHLLKKGFEVTAFALYPERDCSPLNQKFQNEFKAQGGSVLPYTSHIELEIQKKGVILDGIVGTGFRGRAEGKFEQAVLWANSSGLPILAIDIPSAVNGDTGEVQGVAIKADLTIYLGLAKIGFFIGQGWDHVGLLAYADFGLGKKYLDAAKAEAFLYNEERLQESLPQIKRSRHKYETGYVIAMAGSPGMGGAALLSCFAALRAGAGIIRLFHPEGMQIEMSKSPWEVIREEWDLKDRKKMDKELLRARAVLIGPGIGRSARTKNALKKLLLSVTLPSVIDADALYFIAEHPNWKLPKDCILTPHRGEMERLLKGVKESDRGFHALCQKFVEDKGVTLVLKGAPTFIFHPNEAPVIVPRGDPGMAKAGTGDVLTGIVAGLLAQRMPCREAAILGVALHAMAGELVAFQKTSYSIVASDLIDALPEVYSEICS